jgi:predicted ester cyclase
MSATTDHARAALEEVCARGDLARARALYAEDFVDHVNALDYHGQEGIAKSVALYRAVFPDLRIVVEDQTADGDCVTSRWTLHGKHKGRAVTLPESPSVASRTAGSPRTGPCRTTSNCSAGSDPVAASLSPCGTSPDGSRAPHGRDRRRSGAADARDAHAPDLSS